MQRSYFYKCPRCGSHAFEPLSTYSHCIECLYVEDRHHDMESAFHQAMRIERELDSAEVIQMPIKSKQKGAV